MPNSGYPIEDIFRRFDDPAGNHNDIIVTEKCAKAAIKEGLFAEWLESFVGAYIYLKYHDEKGKKTQKVQQPDIIACAYAGIEEWDI